ncbi:hypothetical protein Enr13x_19850 [Stieleria neptunia]|uniref:Uncharacterized protein n=1 Tax=Stieleria neptunia TaxID=2527979 RepID=A0A518HMR2_9BACT|nr:hypothetical protein [Stieleria neptunia]QDV42142.1 hypothetical protein Enr13x_19850 [Stieleria neptunia]
MSRSDHSIDRPSNAADVRQAGGAPSQQGPFRSFGAPQCVVCGVGLTVSEQAVGKTCSRSECKTRRVRQQAQAESRRQQALRDRVAMAEQALVESKSIPAQTDRVLGVLPSNRRRLVGISKRQLRPFIDRLMGIISQAAAIRFGNATLEDDGVGYKTPVDLAPSELAILGNGCAVCRGHCCFQGRGHAFIHVDTVLGYMERHPDQRPRDVLQAYVSRIGPKAYEDSCVYHAENGCTLPRDMRSKVCNGYLCKGLDEILDRLQDSSPEVFVISVSDYDREDCGDPSGPSTRVAVIDAQQVTRYPFIDPAEGGGDDNITSSEA